MDPSLTGQTGTHNGINKGPQGGSPTDAPKRALVVVTNEGGRVPYLNLGRHTKRKGTIGKAIKENPARDFLQFHSLFPQILSACYVKLGLGTQQQTKHTWCLTSWQLCYQIHTH